MRGPLSFLRDRRGVAAVEFALIAPLMIALYFGLAELSMALMAERRASHLASTLADLVAQDAQTDIATLAEVLDAGEPIMEPFPATTSGLRIIISSVVADDEGDVSIAWSRASSGHTPRTKGAPVPELPDDLLATNEGLIMAEVEYDHMPVIGYVIDETMTFKERFFLRPRQAAQVTCTDCD